VSSGASKSLRTAERREDIGELPRRLGIGSSTALIIGFVIGSGIFRSPSRVALEAGSARMALLAWVLGGTFALCGSLSLAELGAMFPRAGGVYVFLYEAYGPAVAFLKGWVYLIVGPSAWAALALIFAQYARTFLPMSEMGVRILAVLMTAVLAGMGCRSVSLAAWVQTISTWAKVAALLAMAVALFFLGHQNSGTVAIPLEHRPILGSLGLALVPVMFAYDGWNGFTAMSGEVRNPGQAIPISLAIGVITVATVYVVVNLAYFSALPFEVVQKSPQVAADAISVITGRAGAALIASLVMLSTFSSLNATVITDPRICFAMSKTGLFFGAVGRVHPRWGTPYVAILLNASLACLYVLARNFDQLAEAFVLGVWPFLALAVAAVPVLRRTRPDLPRPYRTTAYPIVPVVFVLTSIGMILNTLYWHPISTVVSFGVMLIGLPVYWIWRKLAITGKCEATHVEASSN
jgi:APA family basic amino acid/polyamine antiporter